MENCPASSMVLDAGCAAAKKFYNKSCRFYRPSVVNFNSFVQSFGKDGNKFALSGGVDPHHLR